MRIRTLFLFVLLGAALAALGLPEEQVPVPDNIGMSRDWEEPANAELFLTVEHSPRDTSGYGATLYTELGKQSYSD